MQVTHRLLSALDADVVVVLGAGQVLESGPPRELLSGRRGALWRLVESSTPPAFQMQLSTAKPLA